MPREENGVTVRVSAPEARETLDRVSALYELVENESPDLLPVSRWLVSSSHVVAAALEQATPEPGELQAILDLVHKKAPTLLPLSQALIRSSRLAGTLLVEIQLDDLLAQEDWSHPGQVLQGPDLDSLRLAAERRLTFSRGASQRKLEAVLAKIDRARQLAEKARQRRVKGSIRSAT